MFTLHFDDGSPSGFSPSTSSRISETRSQSIVAHHHHCGTIIISISMPSITSIEERYDSATGKIATTLGASYVSRLSNSLALPRAHPLVHSFVHSFARSSARSPG